MMARKQAKKGIIRSDSELEKLAAITPEDIQLAKAWWVDNSRPKYEGLLDAQADQTRRSENG